MGQQWPLVNSDQSINDTYHQEASLWQLLTAFVHTHPSPGTACWPIWTPSAFLRDILIWNTFPHFSMWLTGTGNHTQLQCSPFRNPSLRPYLSLAPDHDLCWPLLTSAWAGPMPYQTLYVQHWDSEQHAVTQNGHLGKRGTEVSLCTLEGSGQPDPEGQSRTEGRSRGSGLKSQSVLILGDSLNFLILNFSPWKSGQWQYQPPRVVGGIQWDHP